MQEMTITEDELNRMRKEEKIHISTKKYLFKKTINEKAFGGIDFYGELDTKKVEIAGTIIGDYDTISNFDTVKIKKAMEVLFDEKY